MKRTQIYGCCRSNLQLHMHKEGVIGAVSDSKENGIDPLALFFQSLVHFG